MRWASGPRGSDARLRPFGAVLALSVGLLALSTASCTGTTDETTVTDSFSGTLQLRSSVWHNFTVGAGGTSRVTLVSLASTAPRVGLAIGQSQNGCQRLTWIDQATTGATLSWDSDPGTHCVLVYDSGSLSEAATYTVSVTHP